MRLICYFILIAIVGHNFQVEAQSHVIYANSNSSLSITDKAVIYIDENASATFNQVLNFYYGNQFKTKIREINAYSTAAIWVAVTIENKKQEKIYLKLKPGFLNQVTLFTVKDEKVVDSTTLGRIFPVKDNLVNAKDLVFSIKPGKFIYFVRVKTDTYLPFTLQLLDKKALYENGHFWNIINGFLFGALVLTILYNLLLYFSVRDSAYLYYLMFVLLAALTLSYHLGIGNQYIWGRYPFISKYITLLYALFVIGTVLFVIRFLELPHNSVRFYRVLQFFIISIVIIGAFDLLDFHYLSNILLMTLSGIVYFFIFIVALIQVQKGNRSARLFSVSWLFSVLAFSVLAVQNLHLFLPVNRSFDILIYGVYTNIILLSLVIGNKLNIYSEDEEKARNKELVAFRERDNIISAQKLKLEKIVKERNKEIINKNQELSKYQNEIENQTSEIEQKNYEINSVNQQLLLTNKKIETQNISLQKNKYELEKTVELRTKALETEKERAIVADTLKTSFLNNLSREIKTPMNAITGYATLILNKAISITQRNEYLHIIIQNVDSLLSLIDNIVTLSRIQAGVLKLKTSEIDLKAFIKLIADEYIEKLKDSKNTNVHIITKIPDIIEGVFIKSDYNKLWLILKLLLENSVKYTTKGVIEIGFNIRKDLKFKQASESDVHKKNSSVIEFFVKDAGKGMSQQDIDKHIVNRDASIQKYHYRQQGLGLAIIVGLVDVFGGKINVVSEEGKGTNFYIEIYTEVIN
ncbi:MAG: 7TM diverse intracellular signaling domain-containing protein [Bacteroidota bacterium]